MALPSSSSKNCNKTVKKESWIELNGANLKANPQERPTTCFLPASHLCVRWILQVLDASYIWTTTAATTATITITSVRVVIVPLCIVRSSSSDCSRGICDSRKEQGYKSYYTSDEIGNSLTERFLFLTSDSSVALKESKQASATSLVELTNYNRRGGRERIIRMIRSSYTYRPM